MFPCIIGSKLLPNACVQSTTGNTACFRRWLDNLKYVLLGAITSELLT